MNGRSSAEFRNFSIFFLFCYFLVGWVSRLSLSLHISNNIQRAGGLRSCYGWLGWSQPPSSFEFPCGCIRSRRLGSINIECPSHGLATKPHTDGSTPLECTTQPNPTQPARPEHSGFIQLINKSDTFRTNTK